MQDLFPQLIQLNISFIFLLLIGAVAFLIAFYLYRKTIPEITKITKYILITIRSLIFFIVILLFLTPSFFLTYKKVIKPKVALFVDNSKSMGYETDNYKRWPETLNAAHRVQKMIPANVELVEFTFNNQIDSVLNEKFSMSEGMTNFNSVINYLKKEDFDDAIIISDGNQTESGYPVPSEWPFDTKIFTVGVGEISSGVDLAINNVVYQLVTYLENENNVEIQLRAENLQKKSTIQLDYYINDKLIQQKQLDIPSGSYNQSINITNINKKVGLNKVRIAVQTVEGETNVLNNKYTFVQNVLDSKLKIGVFSGMPSYDSKFITFILKQIDDFEITQYIEKKNGQFYDQTNLNTIEDLDVFLCVGFPGKYTQTNTMNRFLNVLRQKQPSLIIYMNEYSDQQKLLQLRPWLPYEQLPAKIREMEVSVNNLLSSSISPLLYLFNEKDRNQKFWSKVPPITMFYSGGQIMDGVTELLTGLGSRNKFPIILLNEQPNYRSICINGQGFWKWQFLVQNNQSISDGYQKFLINMLRWVTDRAKLKPVMLKSEKNIVNLGEPVQITGYIYDASFKAIKDGEMIVNAKWDQQTFSIETINDSTGNYLIEFVPPGEGKYTITANGYREGVDLGTDEVEIEVIPIEKEFIRVDQNVNFLKKLAEIGNGYYVDVSDIDSLHSALIISDDIVMKDRIIDIWYHPGLLTIIIVLISLEWILRKRLGLV